MEKIFFPQDKKVVNPPMPTKDTIGTLKTNMKINTFTDFNQLKGVIFGYMDESAQIPEENPVFKAFLGDYPARPYPEWLVKNCQKTQNEVATKFMEMGIEVMRPGKIDHRRHYELEGHLIKGGMHTFSPRDVIFYYHDTIYCVPTIEPNRIYESESMDYIFEQQRANGSKWVDSKKTYWCKNAKSFDAANLIKCGLDILFLISISGNYEGYKEFSNEFKRRYGNKVRIHPMMNSYSGFHVDVTVMPIGYNKKLGKNLVVVSKKDLNPTNMPAIFRGDNWRVLEMPLEIFVDTGCEPDFNFASIWLGMNILIVNPNLIFCDSNQIHIIEWFKKYDIDVVTVDMKVSGSVLGACHCMSNDYNREEDIDFAKILDKKEDLTLEERAGYFDPKLLEMLEEYDIETWEEVCNEKGIFPTYATLHLDEDGIEDLKEAHEKKIAKLG